MVTSLKAIEDQIMVKVRKAQYKGIETKREGIFHVTDFTKKCMRNVFYSKIFGNNDSMDTGKMTPLWVGVGIHKVTMVADSEEFNEMKMAYDFIADKGFILSTKDDIKKLYEYVGNSIEKWFDIVIGSVDDLTTISVNGHDELCIVDKKTWRSRGFKKTSASEDHIKQVNGYRVLINQCHKMDPKYASIVYFDMWQDGIEKPLVCPVELDPIAKTIQVWKNNREQLLSAYMTGSLPPRVIDWLCNGYCPHAKRCFQEEKIPKEAVKIDVSSL